MRILKKISKGFLITLTLLAFVMSVGYILIQSRPFQNWAAQKLVANLSKELKTKISLKNIDFELINTLILEGLYVEDQRGDTLAYFGKLKVNFNYKVIFNSKLQLASIGKASLEDTKINLLLHAKDSVFNYEFIVDYFDQPSSTPGTGNPFKLIIKRLEFKNVDFRYRDMNATPTTGRRFDESYMEYKGINALMTPFKLIGDSLYLDIHDMSFKERSGFEVTSLNAKTILSSTMMEFEDLSIKTPHSSIGDYLKYTYNGWGKFSHFIDEVYWNARLSKSIIGMKDIAYFSDDLKQYNFPVTISGKAKGTLAQLDCNNMLVTIDGINSLKGDVILKNVTDPDKLAYDLKVGSLMANPSSLEKLFKTTFPEELIRLGSVRYSGQLGGGLTDITTKGLIETSIGNVVTDLALKFPEDQPEQYKGKIEVINLDLGKLLNDAQFGTVSMVTNVDGKGFSVEELNTKLQSQVSQFGFNGYAYSNIALDGVLNQEIFEGKFEINDPNANLTFEGMIDMDEENPIGDFKAELGVVNLQKLGYGDINIKQVGKVDIDFEGKDIDNVNGSAVLSNIILEKNDTIYKLGNIDIDASGRYTERRVKLQSDLGNISITGQFKTSELNLIADGLLDNLFPDYYKKLDKPVSPVNVRYDLDIMDSRLLTGLFLPDARFEKFTSTGIYNSVNQNMDIVAHAEYFKYGDYMVRDLNITSVKDPGKRLAVTTDVKGFYVKDSLITDKLNLVADLGGNDINFNLNAADTTHDLSVKSGGNIALSKGIIELNLENTKIFIYNKPWTISDNTRLTFKGPEIIIDSFRISNGIQYIAVDGNATDKRFDRFNIQINKVNLANFNPILSKWGVQLEGLSNGNFTLNGDNTRPVAVSDLTIQNFVYNGDSIGDITLNTNTDNGPYKMAISGKVKNGLINDLNLSGNIDLTPGKDKIDLTLSLKESSIKPFEIFTVGLFSEIEGIADAQIKVKGRLSKPDINGNIYIASASLYMDYLGLAARTGSIRVKIDERKIDLDTFSVFDKYGSRALAGGKIYHTNFDKLNFDLFFRDMNNFNCMNLSETQGDMFYGTAFVDGNVRIKGGIDDIHLRINAKTRPKTVISLPLSGTSENSGPDFIKVVDLRNESYGLMEKKLSGITMDFNFNITRDAQIRLIFDEKLGDVMTATGDGNIEMRLNTFGDFKMYGDYTIATGSYNSTAFSSIINKKLIAQPGGKIVWSGEPADAIVDITAITQAEADASAILPANQANSQNAKNVKVDCKIFMQGTLSAPLIRFGIDLSNDNVSTVTSNSSLLSSINLIKSDQEETNKQFISVLVLGAFTPINAGYSSSGGNVGNSISGSMGALLSNQLNIWLKQLYPNLDLSIDFQQNSSGTGQQVVIKIQREMFKGKVILGAKGANSNDFELHASLKLNKDGSLLLRGYNRKANDPFAPIPNPINSQGVVLYFSKEHDYLFGNWQKKNFEKKQERKAKKAAEKRNAGN